MSKQSREEAGLFMTQYRFVSFEQNLVTDELGPYKTYGIRALRRSGGGWTEAGSVPDVACCADVVLGLADCCTRLQLDACHLRDVVLDAIC